MTRLFVWWETFKKQNNDKFMICPDCRQWSTIGHCMWCGFNTYDVEALAKLRAAQAVSRAKRRAFRQQVYRATNQLFHFHPGDFIAFLQTAIKWTVLGGVVGILAGTASAIFLLSLAWATQTRLMHSNLLFLLPVAGFLVGWIYHHFAGTAALGNNLVIDEVNNNQSRIPLRMGPLVLLGTVMTHLFGGSAGREGTAIQMGASLAEGVQRLFGLTPADRRMMLMAGISGGFGSVFGVPAAGFAFGMEVQSVGRIRYDGIIPCLIAAYVGDLVTRAWGVSHTHYPLLINLEITPLLLLKVALAGIAFGITSMVFVELTHGIKQLMRYITTWSPLYPIVGGVIIIGLTLMLGTSDYTGLSLSLIQHSVDGTGVVPTAFLWKLLFTVITLGTGYLGGEVTPLFVIGSTLGYSLGQVLGVDPAFLASIGLVAVFAGASNTPLACAIMGIELFGGGSTLYVFLGCVVAYLASGHRGIYVTQMVSSPKAAGVDVLADESLKALAARRGGGWLPRLPMLSYAISQKPISAIMSPRVIAVQEDMPLNQVVVIALGGGVRALPVLDHYQEVVGIITDNDLRRSGVPTNLSLLQKMTTEERKAVLGVFSHISTQAIMTQPVQTITQTATLAQAIQQFNLHKLKRLPVVDGNGHLKGVITRSDLLREIAFADPALLVGQEALFNWEAKVSNIALEPVSTISAGAPLHDVIHLMQTKAQKRVVVTDEGGKVSGIISQSDVLSRVLTRERTKVVGVLQGHSQHEMPQLSQTAADIMTPAVVTINAEHRAYEAVRLLMEHQIKRLPVIDATGQVIGMCGRAGLLDGLLADTLRQPIA